MADFNKRIFGSDIDPNIKNKLAARQALAKSAAPNESAQSIEVDGEKDKAIISNFVDNMLSRDSYILRQEIMSVSPDIDLTQEIDVGGETVKVGIPMTVNFFWPDAGA